MTDADWLLLEKIAADPHDRGFVKCSLRHRQVELDLLRARGQYFQGHAAASFYETAIKQLCSRDRETEFLSEAHHRLRSFIHKGKRDPAFRESILQVKGLDHLIKRVAGMIFVSQFLDVHDQMTSESRSPASGSADTVDHDASQFAALQEQQFTDQEIELCLRELQAQTDSSGLELKEFVSELEQMVEES